MKKWLGLAFLLGMMACAGDRFTSADFEPGYCFTAGNGGQAGCPAAGSSGAAGECCSAGNGGQAGAGQAGSGGKASGASGKAGSGGSSKGGSAGSGGSTSGSAGNGGQAGAAGNCCPAGNGGQSGAGAGAGGSGGTIAGAGGDAGQSTGGAGSGGSTSGSGGISGGGQAGSSGQSTGGAGQAGTGGQGPVCGNGLLEAGETCDGVSFGGATCASIKGAGWTGNLACLGCQIESGPCLPPAPTCLGGQAKTPTALSVEGFNGTTTNIAAYELRLDGGKAFDATPPVVINMNDTQGPRIVVAGAKNGINASLLDTLVAHPMSIADVDTNSVTECVGEASSSEACYEKIAKDHWCVKHPNEATWACSNITVIFVSLGNTKGYTVGNPGNNKVVWDIRCQPLPPPLNLNTPNLTRSRDRVLQTDSTGHMFVPAKVGQQTESSALRSKIHRIKASQGCF